MRCPQAIVFDAVGTLIYPDPPVAVVYQDHGRRFGCDLPLDEVRRRFARAFAAEEERDRQAGGDRTSEDRERRRWRRIVTDVFPAAREPDGLFDSLWTHFAQARHWRLFDDVPPLWQALKRRGLQLAVASNFDARLFSIAAGLPPLDRASGVFVSSQLGWRKPAPAFFEAIAAALGCAADDLLMVGDSVANDCQAARAAGWQAVLMERTSPALPGS
jgi:putative hydrolase of the HAD superfamily